MTSEGGEWDDSGLAKEFSKAAELNAQELMEALLAALELRGMSVKEGAEVATAAAAELGLSLTMPVEVYQLRRNLGTETDRGCVLLAASALDFALTDLLRAFLVKGRKADRLLKRDGAFDSFSKRADACLALGLISDEAARDLDLIRRIRNDAAHGTDRFDFTIQKVVNRCRELSRDAFAAELQPREVFIRCAMGVLAHVHARTSLVTRCAPLPALEADPAHYKRLLETGFRLAAEASQRKRGAGQ